MRIPDLPDIAARERMEVEDYLIKYASHGGAAKIGDSEWNPALHPRAGTPPNPGWFASNDGSSEQSPTTTAPESDSRNEVASADETMRPGQKPDLPGGGGGGGFSEGGPVPVQQGGTRSLGNILAPNGKPVGVVNPGAGANIRTVTSAEFDAIRSDLLSDAVAVPAPKGYQGEVFQRPDGSVIGIRNSPENGITIDVLDSTNPAIPPGFKVHQQ